MSQDNGIVWEAPPKLGRNLIGATKKPATEWMKFLPLLPSIADRPGEWAVIHVTDNQGEASKFVSALNRGSRLKSLKCPCGVSEAPEGKWEFCTWARDEEIRVYARYLGEKAV